MKKYRFTEDKFISVPKQAEAGAKDTELVPKHNVDEGNFYDWKSKYGGHDVVAVLDQANARSGTPVSITARHRSGFTARALEDCLNVMLFISLQDAKEKY